MKKTLWLVLISITIGTAIFFLWGKNPSTDLKSTLTTTPKEITPSNTFIDYIDPSGFSFSYPDNLSIKNAKAESEEDSDAYADLQLFSKDKNGSLTVRIIDSKYKSLDDWLKANNVSSSYTPVEKKLGELKALEVKTADRLMLASLDQGVLFTVEMPLLEQDFWTKVYNKVITDFSFASPAADNPQGTSIASVDEVTFEGEEVVE